MGEIGSRFGSGWRIVDNRTDSFGWCSQECTGGLGWTALGEREETAPGQPGVEVVVTVHTHVPRDLDLVARDQLPVPVQSLDSNSTLFDIQFAAQVSFAPAVDSKLVDWTV